MKSDKYQTLKEADESLSNHYTWLTNTLNSDTIDAYLREVLKVDQDGLDTLKYKQLVLVVQPSKTKTYQVWVDTKYYTHKKK